MLKIATCCMNCVYDKSANLAKYMKYIDEAAANGAKLVVFPEQSLQAYLKDLGAMPLSDYEYQHDNAEVVPDGPSTQALIAKAKEKDVYIIWGMTEKSAVDDVIMYNTMVLVGPEGDFSIEEVKAAVEAGYKSVSLGSARLRTETAALSAVMMMQLAVRS